MAADDSGRPAPGASTSLHRGRAVRDVTGKYRGGVGTYSSAYTKGVYTMLS